MTTTTTPTVQRADEVLRRLAAALRAAQLYSAGHPIIVRNLEAWSAAIQEMHALQPSIPIALVGDEVIVDEIAAQERRGVGPRDSAAPAERRRARHHPPRCHLRRAGNVRRGPGRRSRTGSDEQPDGRTAAGDSRPRGLVAPRTVPDAAAHLSRTRVNGTARAGQAARHGDDHADLQRRCVGRRQHLGQRANRRHARRDDGANDDRRAGPGGRRKPERDGRADGAQELRQLHAHPHGERVDSDHGSGARARHRRRPPPRVRPGRADARHRQGPDPARDPQQEGRADRRPNTKS